MNFFKSVFTDDPDEEKQSSDLESPTKPHDEDPDPSSSSNRSHSGPNPNSSGDSGVGWSFGGLLKTLSTQSESVLEIYGRDLKEFGSGLRKETAAFRDVATRAVKELPGSIEVAQGAIDEFGNSVLKSTAEIVSHGKNPFPISDVESDSSENESNMNCSNENVSLKHQTSGFSARVSAIQSDPRTYCEEPEDSEDYSRWKLGFVLEERGEEVEKLIAENGAVGSVYIRVFPSEVDRETFWCRYFYKIHKLKQAEDVRANLVKSATSREDEDDLRWDDEDDGDEVETNDSSEIRRMGSSDSIQHVVKNETLLEKRPLRNDESLQTVEQTKASAEDPKLGNRNSSQIGEDFSGKDKKGENGLVETGAKAGIVTEPKNDVECASESTESGSKGKSKDGEVSAALPDEEDLEWDEMEDFSGNDDKKSSHGGGGRGSLNRTDLRERLSVAEEEEDLSWATEDEDEPVKA